ncbi:SelR domain-containing protein [Epithele typhae]|uniref:SelR domain-containing protein n=1 Tax=Epithele typhae TaxID=378194 RepID=UPI00200831F8|nr:SelR domain-containing protein [Epithele typhae]KAH9935915.1 SelR domain-containing protein [Epithele typhae]
MAATYGNHSTTDDVLALLPNSQEFLLSRPYTDVESRGVLVLVIVSSLSATAVAGLLAAIAISAWNTRKSSSSHLFVRSHVAAYFISLLLCEVAQTVGSIMSIRWVTLHAVSYEPYCTVQGVVKHIADVGTAFWSFIIALNTFWILFLQWKLKRHVLIVAMLGTWAAIGAIVTTGPGALQRSETGPFYAISGYWCWIADGYPTSRITLDYMFMFLSSVLCFIMYILVFLKLRGNVVVNGWRIRVRLQSRDEADSIKYTDTHVINIAKGMLMYPVAYTILLLPIAVCRFAEWSGHEVPFSATIASDAIFLLSGFVNVILFITTRRVLPIHSVVPRRFSRIFRGSLMVKPRSSTYATSSGTYPASVTSDMDPEKSAGTIISYNDAVTRPDAPLAALASAAPTPYTYSYPSANVVHPYSATSPSFTVGSARSEKYDDVSLNSAPARPGAVPAPYRGAREDLDHAPLDHGFAAEDNSDAESFTTTRERSAYRASAQTLGTQLDSIHSEIDSTIDILSTCPAFLNISATPAPSARRSLHTSAPAMSDPSKSKSESEWRAVLTPQQVSLPRPHGVAIRGADHAVPSPRCRLSPRPRACAREQFRILREKGTEPAGTGEYDKHYEEGVYACAGCNAPLYKSATKFKSGCGWPAFFDAIPGAVNRHEDQSLFVTRTEITCAACGGHLGHVFKGEGFKTPVTDERHCVNSISLNFVEENN